MCSTRAIKEHRLLAFLTDLPDVIADVPRRWRPACPASPGWRTSNSATTISLPSCNSSPTSPKPKPTPALSWRSPTFAARSMQKTKRFRARHGPGQERLRGCRGNRRGTPRRPGIRGSTRCDHGIRAIRPGPAPGRRAPPGSRHQPAPRMAVRRLPACMDLDTNPSRDRLAAAVRHPGRRGRTLHDPCWYHPSQAVAVLRDAYMAGRSFAAYAESGSPHGVEVLIRPTIEGSLVHDANRLALLDHALAHDPVFTGTKPPSSSMRPSTQPSTPSKRRGRRLP